MKREVRDKYLNLLSSFMLLIALLHLASCVQSPSGTRKTSAATSNQNTSGDETPNDPTFPTSLNYFQNGATQSTSSLTINTSFTDSFYLRGEEIDDLINPSNKSSIQCLVARFPQSIGNKLLVLAANPQFFSNISTQSLEYYYLISPSQSSSNQTFCNKPGVLNALNTAYPGESVAFSLTTLCPTCTQPLLTSDAVSLRAVSGTIITNVNTSYLSLRLGANGAGTPTGPSCSTSQECKAKSYDCCSLGQCVNDKQVKDGVDTSSSEYLQSVNDILINPANISNYANLYHLCSIEVVPEPTPTPSADPAIEARKKFLKMQELYECTTPIEGEMSLCTSTFENAVAGTTYKTGDDDRSFYDNYTGNNSVPEHSIEKIQYAGEVLYSNRTFLKSDFSINGINIASSADPQGNDTLTDPVSILIDPAYSVSGSAPDTTLKIQYKIDGSCKKVSTNLAKCEKHYVQGESLSKVTDHFPASNEFLLPSYADTSKNIKVEVDDTVQLQGSQWLLTLTSPAKIVFQGSSVVVADSQKVKITFFVNTSNNDVLQSVEDARNQIRTMCDCGTTNCTLVEKIENGSVIDYICKYPDPVDTPPLQQTVLLSSKTVPVRYFDEDGLAQKEITSSTKAQEGSKFEYTSGDVLKPNNVTNNIGFNEIYGSLSYKSTHAKPAKEVPVVKGKSYDIFVDSGNFSSCYLCGSDYFTNLMKLFPNNFISRGGGYTPDLTTTNPTIVSTYPAHDTIFGRACFVPATMIPWTQKPSSSRQEQRLSRMAGQHFLFANGYQRDWYGFDYGSIIGSFDGVKWFSIGNQRRIKAETTKLFLAVNAYFGDQTTESTFTIVVSDASTTPQSGSTVTNDFSSDGAQCQQSHVCTTDRDCATQLGWDYACESVSTIKTKWPSFDSNAQEIPQTDSQQSLVNLIGGLGGSPRRCVYRGRGAPCKTNYEVNDANVSYSGTTSLKLHACSSNNYCQPFSQGVQNEKFNNRIARYGRSARVQNVSSTVTENDLDEFGFGVRSIGRPFSYHGTEEVPATTQSPLNNNNISAICIPGRNPVNDLVKDSNKNIPTSNFLGDQVNGIGMTQSGQSSSTYLSSCSVFDTNGNYILYDETLRDLSLSSSTIQHLAGAQAIPTNSLEVFETLTSQNLAEDFDNTHITSKTYQENRCLRAPGSACHTDYECAPSKAITSKLTGLDPEDSSLYTSVNKYEIMFWQEDLVCAQEKLPSEVGYDLTNNRCCRERGKEISIGNFYNQTGFAALDPDIAVIENGTNSIPGVDNPLNNANRYSRVATMIDKLNDPVSPEPRIQGARSNRCTDSTSGCQAESALEFQWKTISTVAARTCCSGNWIRNFNKADNGGGHVWGPNKLQVVPKESFRCLNWAQCTPASGTCSTQPFTCDHTTNPYDTQCLLRETSNSEGSIIFNWLSTLELTGVPQIAVKSEAFTDIFCKVDPDDQTIAGTTPPPNLIIPGSSGEFEDSAARKLYSANDASNFSTDIKQVFSEDNFSCCMPAGTQMSAGDDAKLCCTGFINGTTNRCALPDYTNISVYFNRYISSEAKDLIDSQIDSKTGYVNNPIIVENLACQKSVCASGVLARGISLSGLKIPGHETSDVNVKRFVDDSTPATNFSGLSDLYDAGLRWNDQVYCVPEEISELNDPNLQVTVCGQ